MQEENQMTTKQPQEPPCTPKASEQKAVAANAHKQTKKQLFWEIFRFLFVGGIATLADYFVFWILDGVLFPLLSSVAWWSVLSLVFATALGFVAGLLVNWILSVKFVYRQVKDKEKASSKKSFWVFTAIGVVGLALTELGVLLLVAVLPKFSLFGVTELFGTSWAKWLAKAIMTCIVLAWNYLGRKLFIFKS